MARSKRASAQGVRLDDGSPLSRGRLPRPRRKPSCSPRSRAASRSIARSSTRKAEDRAAIKGTLMLEDGTVIPIVNTIYDSDRATILHVPAEGAALPRPGARVIARIDWDLRLETHARPYRPSSAFGRSALSGDGRVGRRRGGAARFRLGRGCARQGGGRAPAERAHRARSGGHPSLDRRRRARGQSGPDQDHVGQAADGDRPGPPDRDRGPRSSALRGHAC